MSSSRQQGAGFVWWTNPLWLLLGFILPVYIMVFFAPILLGSEGIVLRGGHFFDAGYFLLGLTYLVVLTMGVANGQLLSGRSSGAARTVGGGGAPAAVPPAFLDAVGVLAVVAYVVWFHGLLLQPWVFIQIFLGGTTIWETRETHSNLPGITSLTQLGIVFFVFYCDALWRSKEALPKRHHVLAGLLAFLTIFRVFAWGERLALIEVFVPIALLFAALAIGSDRGTLRRLAAWAPLFGVIALVGYFAITEAFRSWSFYQDKYDFWPFVTSRVTTYYYTALNNGAGLLATTQWPTGTYVNVLGWLYKFPVFGGAFGAFMGVEDQYQVAGGFLEKYADPEFNNMSGIYTVFHDLGVAGGLVFAWLYGILLGAMHRQFTQGGGLGRFLYPAFYISLLEVMRVLYISESRVFVVVIGVAVGAWLVSQGRSRVVTA